MASAARWNRWSISSNAPSWALRLAGSWTGATRTASRGWTPRCAPSVNRDAGGCMIGSMAIVTGTKLIEERRPGVLSMPAARLVVLRGPDKGRSLRLDREEVTVGTTASAHLVLTDPTVSRNHFNLRVQPDGYL